jgi:hypothetical protein
MNLLKKFLFVITIIILWDIISSILDKGFIFVYNQASVIKYIFKILIIFVLFLFFNLILGKKNNRKI